MDCYKKEVKFINKPVFINVLDLVDLLLDALAGHAVGLQLVDLLVDQVRHGFVKILQKVLDHLWNDLVGLLLVLPLVGQVCFGVACKKRFNNHRYYQENMSYCYLKRQIKSKLTGVQIIVIREGVRIVLERKMC